MFHVRKHFLTAAGLALAAGLLIVGASPAGSQDAKPTLAVTQIDFAAGTVTLTNHGDADVDPNGLIECNFPAYSPLADQPMMAPGDSITVVSAVGIDAASGEWGLYTSQDFENADAIVTYVEWGEGGHQRSTVAAAAGIWDETAVDAGGADVIVAASTNPVAGAEWGAAAATEELGRNRNRRLVARRSRRVADPGRRRCRRLESASAPALALIRQRRKPTPTNAKAELARTHLTF